MHAVGLFCSPGVVAREHVDGRVQQGEGLLAADASEPSVERHEVRHLVLRLQRDVGYHRIALLQLHCVAHVIHNLCSNNQWIDRWIDGIDDIYR